VKRLLALYENPWARGVLVLVRDHGLEEAEGELRDAAGTELAAELELEAPSPQAVKVAEKSRIPAATAPCR